MNKLEVVVGAQFGSEAKGHIVQRLTERAQREGVTPQVIRVAGPNAGHTGYDVHGTPWALRQVPVAAVTDDIAVLGIGAGSEIDLPVLLDEYDRLREARLMVGKMLWVSGEATLIDDQDKIDEVTPNDDNGLNMVGRIGSTGKGIGAARAGRLWRQPGRRLIDNAEAMNQLAKRGIAVADAEFQPATKHNRTIIEGTQGYGLGLRAGFYPRCTSSDCRAGDFMAMAGIHAWEYREVEVWAVARIYPIRVAGNSGPLRNETSWEELGLPEERTTVTKKVRRVGYPDWDLVRRAVRANGGAPTVRLAITMMDQMMPDLKGKEFFTDETIPDKVRKDAAVYLRDVERETQAKVECVTTGPNTASFGSLDR